MSNSILSFYFNFWIHWIQQIFTYSQRRQWHPTPLLFPGKSHGRRSLVGCSPWGLKESDTTEWLHFHFSLLCIGEGNGNLLQCSCLENPRDGVTQSWTWLKWLSSSSYLFYSFIIHLFDKYWLCAYYKLYDLYPDLGKLLVQWSLYIFKNISVIW